MTMIKNKSATLPKKMKMPQYEKKSENSSSRNSSVRRTTKIARPFSVGKRKSADDDCIILEKDKLLPPRTLKVSTFSKVHSTEALPDFKRVKLEEKLESTKMLHSQRQSQFKKHTIERNPLEDVKESIYLNASTQQKLEQEEPYDQSTRCFKKNFAQCMNNNKATPGISHPEEVLGK